MLSLDDFVFENDLFDIDVPVDAVDESGQRLDKEQYVIRLYSKYQAQYALGKHLERVGFITRQELAKKLGIRGDQLTTIAQELGVPHAIMSVQRSNRAYDNWCYGPIAAQKITEYVKAKRQEKKELLEAGYKTRQEAMDIIAKELENIGIYGNAQKRVAINALATAIRWNKKEYRTIGRLCLVSPGIIKHAIRLVKKEAASA